MFERYTEAARRCLFFARYECSTLGSMAIETELVLLGLARQGGFVAGILEPAGLGYEEVRAEVEKRIPYREKVATSVEIPFSEATKRALRYSEEEADRLGHSYIGTEHLLLGLLREDRSGAASILTSHGLTLARARDQIVKLLAEAANEPPTNPDAREGHALIDSITRLVVRLREKPLDTIEVVDLAARIQHEL